MALRFAEFELDRVVFEARYAKAYRLWDSAGALALACTESFPGVDNAEANPSKIVFISADRKLDIAFEMERLGVTLHGGKGTMEDIADLAQRGLDLGIKHLQLIELERVGTRAIFTKVEKSLQDATAKVLETGVVAVKPGGHFAMKSGPQAIDARIRWEEGSRGVLLSARSEKLSIAYRPPREFQKEIEAREKEVSRVVLDVDYYTPKPVLVTQFSARDWISSLRGICHRDVPNLLNFL